MHAKLRSLSVQWKIIGDMKKVHFFFKPKDFGFSLYIFSFHFHASYFSEEYVVLMLFHWYKLLSAALKDMFVV